MDPVHDRLVVREVVEGRALRAEVAHAYVQRVDAGEHVELGDHEAGEAVDPSGVLQRHEVEPSGAAGPAGGGAELAAGLADLVPEGPFELGGERTGADP